MNISCGSYSASVGPASIGGRRTTKFQIVVSRYGMPIYEQLEHDFEEAMRVAGAFIEWQPDQHNDG